MSCQWPQACTPLFPVLKAQKLKTNGEVTNNFSSVTLGMAALCKRSTAFYFEDVDSVGSNPARVRLLRCEVAKGIPAGG